MTKTIENNKNLITNKLKIVQLGLSKIMTL